MANYYDWQKTLSYDADVTFVVGARGIGKTYGLRLQFIRDYIKTGARFVEISRFKSEIPDVASGYFDRLASEFPDYQFRTDGRHAYIAPKVEGKPQWEVCGYFVALTELQRTKKRTFINVYRLLLDEAAIDTTDRFHRYLPSEFSILANLVDSCSRERADDDSRPPRVYLLANAVNLLNPYFIHYGIDSPPEFGYHWYGRKTLLLHYVKDDEYAKEKSEGTVAGRMLRGTTEGAVAASNIFAEAGDDSIEKKPSRARFEFGLRYLGRSYGVWYDEKEVLYYVTHKIPGGVDKVYALTTKDSKVDLRMVRRASPLIKRIVSLAEYSMLRFESVGVKQAFYEAIGMFGLV